MKDLETDVQHHEPIELSPHNRPLTFPIYQGIKFEQDTYDHFLNPKKGDFVYSRISNPSVRQLEVLLARLQAREDAICFASGIAAIAVPFLALLKAEDHVIMFAEGYMPSRHLIRNLLEKFGVTHTMLYYDQLGDLKYIMPTTQLIFFESPTNPNLTVPDITKVTSVARQSKILTILDNTLAGFHQHGEFDVDIFVHSLTKFASGHGDVLGGAVIASSDLIASMKGTAINLGSTLDPHSAFLISRGMKTYFVRYRAQCANALQVAKFLRGHPKIKRVVYPGLEDHPDYEIAKKQMKDSGSIITIDLHEDVDKKQFFDRLRYFHLAGSLGSTESLVMPLKKHYGADLAVDQLEKVKIFDSTVRLSIGLESAKDLIQDLELALI